MTKFFPSIVVETTYNFSQSTVTLTRLNYIMADITLSNRKTLYKVFSNSPCCHIFLFFFLAVKCKDL